MPKGMQESIDFIPLLKESLIKLRFKGLGAAA
jgi:hypothetical protein